MPMRVTVTLWMRDSPKRQVMRWSGPASTYNEAARRAMPALRALWAAMAYARGAAGSEPPDEIRSPRPTFRVEQSRHGEDTTWVAGLALCEAVDALPRAVPPELPDLREIGRSIVRTHYARRLLREDPKATISTASGLHGNGRLKQASASPGNVALRVDRRSGEMPDGDLTEALIALEAIRRMTGAGQPTVAPALRGLPESATLRAAISFGRTEFFAPAATSALRSMGLGETAGEIEGRNAELARRAEVTRALLAREPDAREYALRLALEGCRSYATGLSDDATAVARAESILQG